MSYSSIYRNTSFFCPHAARQTRSLAFLTRFIAPLCGDIPPPRAFRVLFARLPPSPRRLLPPNCRSTTRPDSFGSLYSRKRCRGAHFIMFSFHVEHTSCHSPKPQHLSRFSLVYAYLYIASLHVFRLSVCFFRPCDPFPVVAPRLTIAPRRRSAAFVSEPRIAARLAVFVGARLHSVFSRSCLPLFLISRSLFASCSMTYRKLFVCFSLPSAFRASLRGSAPHLRPSLIRPHLKRSPLPNLSILLDTVLLLLYNYLAFACESPLFVSFWLYKATRSDRPSAVRSVEQRHKTTTK